LGGALKDPREGEPYVVRARSMRWEGRLCRFLRIRMSSHPTHSKLPLQAAQCRLRNDTIMHVSAL